MGALNARAEWGWVSSGPHSRTLADHWLLQLKDSFNIQKYSLILDVWALEHAYLYISNLLRNAYTCVCFPVCCELSLTPNSLSLIGCVILGEDKEGHWRGARGGGNRGNERALPITAWPVASPRYKGTLILPPHTAPAAPATHYSFPTLAPSSQKKKTLLFWIYARMSFLKYLWELDRTEKLSGVVFLFGWIWIQKV